MNERKQNPLFLVLGIVIIIIGIAVMAYPLIQQKLSENEQDMLMDDVKTQILENMIAQNKANEDLLNAAASQGNTDSSDSSSGIEASETTDTTLDTAQSATEFVGSDASMDVMDGSDDLGAVAESNSIPVQDYSIFESDRLKGQIVYGIIESPAIDLTYAIVEGVEDRNIGYAIGHFPKSVGIGEEGNCALAGHNGGTYGQYFRDIKNLKIGDEVYLTNLKGQEYKYIVTDMFQVEPTDTYVVKDLGVKGKYLTMVTCCNGGKQRLIVRAQCTENPKLYKITDK